MSATDIMPSGAVFLLLLLVKSCAVVLLKASQHSLSLQAVLREAESAGLTLDADSRSSTSDLTSPTSPTVRLYPLWLPLSATCGH